MAESRQTSRTTRSQGRGGRRQSRSSAPSEAAGVAGMADAADMLNTASELEGVAAEGFDLHKRVFFVKRSDHFIDFLKRQSGVQKNFSFFFGAVDNILRLAFNRSR